MIKSLRETKTRLSEYVQLAGTGEDVIITVRGKPKARLTAIYEPQLPDRKAWAKRLSKLHKGYVNRADSAVAVVRELRKDRF